MSTFPNCLYIFFHIPHVYVMVVENFIVIKKIDCYVNLILPFIIWFVDIKWLAMLSTFDLDVDLVLQNRKNSFLTFSFCQWCLLYPAATRKLVEIVTGMCRFVQVVYDSHGWNINKLNCGKRGWNNYVVMKKNIMIYLLTLNGCPRDLGDINGKQHYPL